MKGRKFEPTEGLGALWCPECIKIGGQMQFFSSQTAEMIRHIWNSYAATNLPKEVKLFLEQYTAEILKELNEEL